MKLSDYARQVGVSYKTAWRWFRAGKINGYQMDTGTVIVTEGLLTNKPESAPRPSKVAIYARVSSIQKEEKLNLQAQQLEEYCNEMGWQVDQTIKEIGSGDSDNRPKLLQLLADSSVEVIVVEGKDRLALAGFNYIETLLKQQGRWIEIAAPEMDNEDE